MVQRPKPPTTGKARRTQKENTPVDDARKDAPPRRASRRGAKVVPISRLAEKMKTAALGKAKRPKKESLPIVDARVERAPSRAGGKTAAKSPRTAKSLESRAVAKPRLKRKGSPTEAGADARPAPRGAEKTTGARKAKPPVAAARVQVAASTTPSPNGKMPSPNNRPPVSRAARKSERRPIEILPAFEARAKAARPRAARLGRKARPPYLAEELGQPVDHEGEPIGAGSAMARSDTELQAYTLRLWRQMQSGRSVDEHLQAVERAGLNIDDIWMVGITETLSTSSTPDEARRYRQKLLFRANLLEAILSETVAKLIRLDSNRAETARDGEQAATKG